jgi:hypothetical protein
MGSHGSGYGGFASRPAFRSAGHFGPVRGFAPRANFSSRGFASRGQFGHSSGFRHHRNGFRGSRFFFHRRFSRFGASFGWWGFPFFYSYPYYSYPYDTSAYDSTAYDSSATADYFSGQQQLETDIQGLRDEVRGLRQELKAAPSAPPASPAEAQTAKDQLTVLVFLDGRQSEVRNYAIVGQTLWTFDEKRATKIPLSNLNVEATAKANESRGVEFRLPRK